MSTNISSVSVISMEKELFCSTKKQLKTRYGAVKGSIVSKYFEKIATDQHHEIKANMDAYISQFCEVFTETSGPVKGEVGVMAKEDIATGTILGMYAGLISTEEEFKEKYGEIEGKKARCYVWEVTGAAAKKEIVYIDGSIEDGSNILKFINDARNYTDAETGTKMKNNVKAVDTWWCGSPRVIYLTICNIKKGDELFINYGQDFEFGSSKKIDSKKGEVSPPKAPNKKDKYKRPKAIGGAKRKLDFSEMTEEGPPTKRQKPDTDKVKVEQTLIDCGLGHLLKEVEELGVVNMTLFPLLKQTKLYTDLPVIQRIALDNIIQKKCNSIVTPGYM